VRVAFEWDGWPRGVRARVPGYGSRRHDGLGLVSMRERAEIVGGHIEFLEAAEGGALVRFTLPAMKEDAHAAAESSSADRRAAGRRSRAGSPRLPPDARRQPSHSPHPPA